MEDLQHITSIFPEPLTEDEKTPSRWGILFAAFMSYLVLPNLILSHSAIMLYKVENEEDLSSIILAPLICSIVFLFCESLFQDAAEDWCQCFGTRILSAAGYFLCFIGVATSPFITSQFWYCINFGLLCGIGASLALTQINFILNDLYYNNVTLIQVLTDLGQSVGLFAMPYIIMILFHLYGTKMGYFCLSCIVLQLLPVAFFIKDNQKKFRTAKSTIVSSVSNQPQEFQLIDLSKSKPNDEIEKNDVNDNKNVYTNTCNEFNKLPPIIEENDSDFSNSDASGILNTMSKQQKIDYAIHRYSKISDQFDELIFKNDAESFTVTNNIYNISEPNLSLNTLNDLNYKHKTLRKGKTIHNSVFHRCCNSYHIYKLKRKFRNLLDYIKDSCVRPTIAAFKMWQFYPALLIKTNAVLIPLSVSLLLPFVDRLIEEEKPLRDAVFVLTIYAFGWLCSLIASPWTINMSKSKYQYFVFIGFFISSIGLTAIMLSKNSFTLTLPSVTLGICHGSISLTCREYLKELIGAQNWSKIRNILDKIKAVILLCFAFWIQYLVESNNLRLCFGILSAFQGITGLFIGFIILYKMYVKISQINI